MKGRISSVITGIVGAVTAVATGCTSCPTTETVRSEQKEVEVSAACAWLGENGSAFRSGRCDLCGPGFNDCNLDQTFAARWYEASRADGGVDDTVCPAPEDGRTTVKVFCRETREDSELQLGGPCADEGRRPEGLLPPLHLEDGSAPGLYFATSAHLEAAAVLAFDRMIDELEAHGAPQDLLLRARVARGDEVRHAQVVGDLARRYGVEPAAAVAEPRRPRSLFEIALENEVEGVVRETVGAAIATFRAERAGDAEVRRAMASIAEDERAHAELSWALADWARARLGDEERRLLDAARRAAVAELREAFRRDPAREVMAIAGAPGASDVAALLAHLDAELWSVAA